MCEENIFFIVEHPQITQISEQYYIPTFCSNLAKVKHGLSRREGTPRVSFFAGQQRNGVFFKDPAIIKRVLSFQGNVTAR